LLIKFIYHAIIKFQNRIESDREKYGSIKLFENFNTPPEVQSLYSHFSRQNKRSVSKFQKILNVNGAQSL